MPEEVLSFAFINAISENRKYCPDISHIFILKENGEILGAGKNIIQDTASIGSVFDALIHQAVVGGLESLPFKKFNIWR